MAVLMGTFELINAIVSLFGGGLLTIWAQARKDRHEEFQRAMEWRAYGEQSAVSAREFTAPWQGYYWIRGLIALLAASYFFVVPLVAMLLGDVGVVIGYYDTTRGFWPWSSSIEMVTWIQAGPADAARTLVYDPVKNNIMINIAGMYFGNQFARRA